MPISVSEAQREGVLVGILVAALTMAWAWRPIWNIDLFWHIAAGREIIAHGIPATDVFSAADDTRDWVSFQWGYQVLVAWLDGLGGLGWVRFSHVLALGLALGFWSGHHHKTSKCTVSSVLATLVLLVLFEDRIRFRPHLLELLFFVILLPWVRTVRWGPHVAWMLLLAPVWANVHAVSALWWVVLVAVWALCLGRLSGWLVWAGGLVAMALSPGAIRGVLAAVSSHREWPQEFVPELRGTWAYVGEGWWGWLVLALVCSGVVSAVVFSRGTSPLSEKLLGVGCALASVLLARWAWLASVPIVFLLGVVPGRVKWCASALLVLGLGARAGTRWSWAERFMDIEPGRFPEQACDLLEEKGLRLKTDTTGSWAGYLLYRLHPPATVLADGRLVFSEEVAEILRRRGQGDASTFDEVAIRYRTEVLVWPAGQLPALDNDRWKSIYADGVAEVWLPSFAWKRLD
ncbi:MAG: hypothetical protein VX519_11140 [Myxococcota bacterium]|nr:hypothetical protein [Myxococcota bacterium]